MRSDALEGSAYSLPRCLQFDVVKNLEELSSLEASSLVSKPPSNIPISLWVKVVRETNLIERASEEDEMIMKEFKAVERTMKDEHSMIQQHLSSMAQSSICSAFFRNGFIHFLKRKLLQCEASLLNFAKTVSKYHTVDLPPFHLIIAHNQSFDLPQLRPVSNPVDIIVSDLDNSDSDSDEDIV